jgi:aspartate oxidase
LYAKGQLNSLRNEIDVLQEKNEQTQELRNMIQTAIIITKAANNRKESLGTHYLQPYL